MLNTRPMPLLQPLLQRTHALLQEQTGLHLELGPPVALESSHHTVLRCALYNGSPHMMQSVIIKQLPADQRHEIEKQRRYLTEWVALRFLSTYATGYAPRFIAGDAADYLAVIADLGDHSTLAEILQRPDSLSAQAALVQYGRYLAHLQYNTRGHEAAYWQMAQQYHLTPAHSDEAQDWRQRLHDVSALFSLAGGVAPAGLLDEIVMIEHTMHDDATFRTFVHYDAGPHNVIVGNDGIRLIDFEYGQYGHGFVDLASARMAWPSYWWGQPLSASALRLLETAYRDELAQLIPALFDEGVYETHLAMACGHILISKLLRLTPQQFKALLLDGATHPLPPGFKVEQIGLLRQMVVTWLAQFIMTATQLQRLPDLRGAAEQLLQHITNHWPDVQPRPIYTALV